MLELATWSFKILKSHHHTPSLQTQIFFIILFYVLYSGVFYSYFISSVSHSPSAKEIFSFRALKHLPEMRRREQITPLFLHKKAGLEGTSLSRPLPSPHATPFPQLPYFII